MTNKLTDDSEVLFRQIHPNFLHEGEPSSQPFAPTPKDAHKLSVDRSTLTTAVASFELFNNSGHTSVAVYGLTVGEFREQELPCFSDPLVETETQTANPAHAAVDYSAHSGGQQKNKAKRLKQSAIARGRIHP